jgi:hypothetical protein
MFPGKSGKHLQQNTMPDFYVNVAHFFSQPDLDHAPHLIQQNAGVLACKNHFRPTTHGAADTGKGRNDDAGKWLLNAASMVLVMPRNTNGWLMGMLKA